jgi:Mitochondrial mRNA-processing protein COX24, C-terminal
MSQLGRKGHYPKASSVQRAMGSLIKKRRKRMRKKKHKKMLKRTRFQRRAAGK